MNGGFNTSGFTIIETLIVLGVTALLLFSVLVLIGGKTNQAQFTSAINNVKTSLQQVIDNASSGSYPNEAHFSCSFNGSSISINGNPPAQQGSNYGCTFIGSMIAFSGNYSQPTAANQQYTVYAVVGQQCTASSYSADFSTCNNPTDLGLTNPYLIPASYGTVLTQTLFSGISLVSTRLTDTVGDSPTISSSPSTPPRIAFLVNPAQQTTADSPLANLSPGAIQLSLYSYTSGCNPTSGPLLSATCSLIAENQIDLCFASATTNQSGLVTLGGGGLESTISLQIFGGNSCGGE